MAIPIEFFSVVIPINVIKGKYQGGLEQYITDVPNGSYVEDEYLTRVGFMSETVLHKYCELLISKGLHYNNDTNYSTDFVVVQSLFGKKWDADWLRVDENDWASFKGD